MSAAAWARIVMAREKVLRDPIDTLSIHDLHLAWLLGRDVAAEMYPA